MQRMAASTLAVLLALSGCTASRDRAEPSVQAAPGAELLAPEEGDTVSLPVTIRLRSRQVQVVAASGQRVEGEGHYHLFVDADLPAADSPIAQAPGYIHIGTGAAEWTLSDLPQGPHRVIVVLGYGDHVPMAGVATDTVHFVVR